MINIMTYLLYKIETKISSILTKKLFLRILRGELYDKK